MMIEIFAFMHDWLQAHILQSDIEFGRFITVVNNQRYDVNGMGGKSNACGSGGDCAWR
jgi:hypothetical protein